MRPQERRSLLGVAEEVAPWLAGVLLALPVVLVHYPPMGDLGAHEGLASVLCHWKDPRWNPPGLYRVFIPQANQLFALLVAALGFVLPTELAAKLVVGATGIASTVGLARLLRHLRLSRWLSLLVTPVLYGWMFSWGLAPNLTGLAVMILTLPSLEAYAEKPTGGRFLVASTWLALTFLGHESAAVVCGLFAAVLAVGRAPSARGLVARLWPVVVVVGLIVAQDLVSRALIGDVMNELGSAYATPLPARVRMIPSAIFGSIKPRDAAGVALLCLVALVASAARAPLVPYRRRGGWLLRRRYWLLALGLLGLYFAFPMTLNGATMLAFRFVPGLCIGVIVACARRRTRPIAIAAACLVPVAVVASQAAFFAKADAFYGPQDRVIEHIEPGSSVAQLDWSPTRNHKTRGVFNDRVMAARGGRVLFSFADRPPNPLYIPAALQWNEPVRRLATTPFAFMPSFDFHRFTYVLARCDYPPLLEPIARAVSGEADLVASDGAWLLFRSRLDPWPIVSPDVPLPSPPPETLGERLAAAHAPGT